MLDTIRRHGITLALFAAGTTGLSALVYTMTKSVIAEQAAMKQRQLFEQIISPDLYNNDMIAECYIVADESLGNSLSHRVYIARKDDKPVAAAIESTAPDGYSGAIQLLVAADFAGHVLGSRVTEHNETPGLGDKIDTRISDWITHFSGKSINPQHHVKWAVKKDGGEFDQFTGATITPRAVVNAVNRTAIYIQTVPEKISTLSQCGEE